MLSNYFMSCRRISVYSVPKSRKLCFNNGQFHFLINQYNHVNNAKYFSTPIKFAYYHTFINLNSRFFIYICKNESHLSKYKPFDVKKYSSNVSSKETMVRILNVAEKNDAAKNVAEILSRGGYTKREGFGKFNKIYEFETVLHGERCHMVMTSVSGHLLNQSFTGKYKKWNGCNPIDLFDAPVVKICQENMQLVKRTLEREAISARRLIIWTDCDREGENIGFEIISVCKEVNKTMQVQRAKFSEITFQSVTRALQNLGLPDQKQNDAVEVRSELDLRIGAAFTRFQTLRLQKVFPQALAQTLISYGSCQFPTLGFVVERYKAIEDFIPEQFWKLKVMHEIDNFVVEFRWRRVRLFEELACQILLDKCQEIPRATVKSVNSKTKSKWRPQPLDTIELEKLGSRKLRINAKETMRVAEKLYTSGYISYPRTETNIFPKELDLMPLIQNQTQDPNWGDFASRLVENGPTPRQGKKCDQAHPPIHPTKYASNLQGNEKIIYEFIVRHFLACCDKDAKGMETVVTADISGEEFVASGLIIHERNYLEVYPYDKWSDKEMPQYEQGSTFEPTTLEMVDGQTSPPPLLTEADLIALMEKHGIGTDATHADHIETIKNRMYVGLQDTHFVPGELGMGLVEGYDAMGFHMSKPNLRAEFEADLKRICEGTKDPKVVLREQINNYKNVFKEAMKQAAKIDVALGRFLNEVPETPAEGIAIPDVSPNVMKCSLCGSDIVVKSKRDGNGLYLSCQGFPECKAVLWLPETVKKAEVMDEKCSRCAGSPRKLKFTFAPRSYTPVLPNEYISCIGGCDSLFMDTLGIQSVFSGRQNQRNNGNSTRQNVCRPDSGYGSSSNSFTPSPSTTQANRQTPTNRTNPLRQISSSIDNNNAYNNNGNSTIIRTNNSNSNNRIVNNNSNNSSFGISSSNSASWNQSSQQSSQHSSFGGRQQPSTSRDNLGRTPQNNRNNNQPSWGGAVFDDPDDDDDDKANAIVCNCNDDAIILTVRKEGPNTGRQFYKCRQPQGQGCTFFLWADEGAGTSALSQRPNGNDGFPGIGNRNGRDSNSSSNASGWGNDENNSNVTDSVQCNCGIFAKRLTTLKEGPNKGREFYVCSKIREEQCGFFQWADEVDSAGRGGSGGVGGRGGGGRGGGRGAMRNSSGFSEGSQGSSYRVKVSTRGSGSRGGIKRKAATGDASLRRRCGLCGDEGHDRRNCPHK